jgi:hypothetical protein
MSETLINTVDALTTALTDQKNAQKDALINGTVSEEAVDNFCQAREDNYLDDSYNKFISAMSNEGTGDDAILGAQQVNAFISGFQQAYLQRRRTALSRCTDRLTTQAQNASEFGVIPTQLKNVGVIVDSQYIIDIIQPGQGTA